MFFKRACESLQLLAVKGGREEEREDDDAQLKASSGRSHCPAKISGRT